jgi:hypothetical protein
MLSLNFQKKKKEASYRVIAAPDSQTDFTLPEQGTPITKGYYAMSSPSTALGPTSVSVPHYFSAITWIKPSQGHLRRNRLRPARSSGRNLDYARMHGRKIGMGNCWLSYLRLTDKTRIREWIISRPRRGRDVWPENRDETMDGSQDSLEVETSLSRAHPC